MNQLPNIHFTDNYLLHPYNPVTVNLIGAGGTGSQMLTALARMNHSLTALGHAGLQVTLYDDDKISEANLGRQLFAESEIGLYKSLALINRVNRFFGTNWKAITKKFCVKTLLKESNNGAANINISCVDTVAARYEIATVLKEHAYIKNVGDKILYWMDCGNAQFTGQVILSTLVEIKQPDSKKFTPIATLPLVTDEFKLLLDNEVDNNEPSCSLAEALEKQDLYINSTIANLAGSLLWQLFREGMVENRGFFVNLKDFRVQPLKVA
ncbi:PRTRC system ThiF family protein [Mucilaginibacter boryungensis]|uniref:PRTRC system ThiF family protein n=1 Tax=Mucilaginibacter boryungensis TaxID=768480 RepID=A0ABR9XLE7_9SPHI|nr:PRTRC system ThiF family protein [Mucilaginibacter boryungensis]MBE9668101.1 PRTRC system ThiF family protein [Mucilaginibacter boryungensis]